jgi:hypothetical protein
MRSLADFRLLLLALWLGAAVFFIAVAQSAFSVMPTRELAGMLVTRTLAILNYSGIGVSIVLVLTSLIVIPDQNRLLLWLERILLTIVGLACAVSQFVISWWLLMLRTQMARPIDEVPVDDPLRIQFNNLHEYSSWTMIIAMAAAFVAFFIISARRSRQSRRSAIGDLDIQSQFKL